MRLWKAPLATQIEGATDELREDARAYCFAHNIVGLGWGLDNLIHHDTDDFHDYRKTVEVNRTRLEKEWGWNVERCLSNHLRFTDSAQEGDLVWSRSTKTGYWVGKLFGGWSYRRADALTKYDINQTRGCAWYAVGDTVDVPGAIINQFGGRGQTFTEIHSGGETLVYLCVRIYSQKSGEEPRVMRPISLSVLDNIAHAELENLVGLYLQAVHGWFIVPSTVKKSTPATEFSMVNSKGEIAGVQVKAGSVGVPTLSALPPDVSRFYIFEASPQFRIEDQADELKPLLSVIQPNDLLQWALSNLQMIPNPIRILLTSE